MTPAEILEKVAADTGVDIDALRGPDRTGWVCRARRLAAQKLAALEMGPTDIGRVLKRNHSTVLYLLGRKGVKGV